METLNLIGRKIAEIFRLPVMLGWMLLGYGTFVAGGIYVVDRVTELASEAELRENREQDEEIYEAKFRAWELKLILYVSCLNAVAGREDNRRQWVDFYDYLQPQLGGNGPRLLAELMLRLDITLPTVSSVELCVKPGNPPTPPPGVVPHPRDVVSNLLPILEGG